MASWIYHTHIIVYMYIQFVLEGSLVAGNLSTVECSPLLSHASSQTLEEPMHLNAHQEGTVGLKLAL